MYAIYVCIYFKLIFSITLKIVTNKMWDIYNIFLNKFFE